MNKIYQNYENAAVIRPEIQVITDVEEVFFDGLIEAWRVAIENIMENAFRYAKSYIKIEVREDWLCISNDGPKMPEDRIQSLFRPYEKGEGGRFGLGLSIVTGIERGGSCRIGAVCQRRSRNEGYREEVITQCNFKGNNEKEFLHHSTIDIVI